MPQAAPVRGWGLGIAGQILLSIPVPGQVLGWHSGLHRLCATQKVPGEGADGGWDPVHTVLTKS